ncbi:RtcB family protein [Candidatus Margulisiibacteriota bacterium]
MQNKLLASNLLQIFNKKIFKEVTKKQNQAFEYIRKLEKLDIFKKIILLPDFQKGLSVPIGTVTVGDKNSIVSPELVGDDIGCGYLLLKTDLYKYELQDVEIASLMETIKYALEREKLYKYSESLLYKGTGVLDNELSIAYEQYNKIKIRKKMDEQIAELKLNELGARSFGTIGKGNHFLEMQYVSDIRDPARDNHLSKGNILFLIHTGSRNIGSAISQHYLNKLKNSEFSFPGGPLSSPMVQEYLNAYNMAMNFSFANRLAIANVINQKIKQKFGLNTNAEVISNASHNYVEINRDTIIHRKGANTVDTDRITPLPGTVANGTYYVAGSPAASKLTYNTIGHGAGRLMSSNRARFKLDIKKYKEQLRKIYTTYHLKQMLHEAPNAYKDIDAVMDSLMQFDLIKPLYKANALASYKQT